MLTRCTPYETMNIMKTACLSMMKSIDAIDGWSFITRTRLINDYTFANARVQPQSSSRMNIPSPSPAVLRTEGGRREYSYQLAWVLYRLRHTALYFSVLDYRVGTK